MSTLQPGPYEPTWDSLDTHPLPTWFDEAKFGMFVDWGLYSVAGWAPRRESGAMYPDWYLYNMYYAGAWGTETIAYHQAHWGADFARDDFIPLFTASAYDPSRLVEIAQAAGMRYIIPFCKHHDGFCLWPSSYTHRNAGEMGPRRDLVRPLVDACRAAGLKFGFYFSVDEWEYPILDEHGQLKLRTWSLPGIEGEIPYVEQEVRGKITGKIPVRDFIQDYIHPQAREFIARYDPDILWFDGEWTRPADYYRTRELVAEFYNQAAGRKEVLVNDRLGKGERGRHGDVFTSEYGSGEGKGKAHKWEENRGISQSFGYNREDTDANVLTAEALIHMLIEIVSEEGNLLLIVNLDGQGALPPIYEQRLRAAGDWLRMNGEAIYGTHAWRTHAEGERLRYTCKGEDVYAISLVWPGPELALSAVQPSTDTVVTLLGHPVPLRWRYTDRLLIEVPPLPAAQRPCQAAYAFRITHAH